MLARKAPDFTKAIGDDRRRARDDCDLSTIVSFAGVPRLAARIVNISADGCAVRIDHLFARDDRMRLLLPVVGDYQARVVWGLLGVCGCRFIDPIDQATYRRVLAAIKTGRETWPAG